MTVLDVRHLEAKLAGDLSAGYLALKLTGEQVKRVNVAPSAQAGCKLYIQTQHPDAGGDV